MTDPGPDFDYAAYCGLYCGACAVLLANERGGVGDLLRYEEPGYTVEDLTCRGCRTDVTSRWCADCGIRACAREKGLAFCSGCGEYPCGVLKSFDADEHPHHAGILNHLDAIITDGPAAWLASQRERWKCPGCGARFTWYEEKCGSCGATLHNCRDEKARRARPDLP